MNHRLPRFVIVLLISFATAAAQAQCYVDPYTGQQICMRPSSGCPSCERQVRRLVSDSPAAEPQSPTVDSTAHCRISVADGTMGSGSLIDRNDKVGLVLTCAHLFDTSTSQIVVTFSNGSRFGANLVDLDKANDLAALAVRPPNITPLTVSENDPTGLLTACGFGPNGVFRCIRGAITGHPMASGATYASTTITGAVRPGDSGGPVLDSQGQVVGVVWGQRDGQSYATCGQPVRDFLKSVRTQIFDGSPSATTPTQGQPPIPNPQPPASHPQVDWQAWTNELDKRIHDLEAKKQDKGEYLQPGDLNRYLKVDDATKLVGQFAPRSEIDDKLKTLTSQFASIHNVVETVRQHVDQITGGPTGIIEGVSLAKYAVGALGLSGPLAVAVIVAGGLFGGRTKSRLKRLESIIGVSPSSSQTATTKSQPVAVDSPPPPQRSVPETHYVPVEKDSFAKAHQWASEHVARKYPGATEVLQAQDSLIKQYLASK